MSTKQPIELTLVEKLFARTVVDLSARLEGTDGYDLIMASGLIRKLVLDATPLTVLANRRHRFKLTYPYNEVRSDVADGVCIHGFNFKLMGKLDQMLSSHVIYIDKEPYSAKEVILTCANSFGGVHGGEITDPRLRKLIQISLVKMGIIIEGGAMETALLAGVWCVGQGVLRGVDPLFEHLVQGRRRKDQPILKRLFHRLTKIPMQYL